MKKLFLAAIISLLLFASITLADIPKFISVQGILSDPVSGEPLSGSYILIFRIFDVQTGGAALWSDNKPVNLGNDGLFNVELGPLNLNFDKPYYVEVQISGQPSPLTPRINMTSVAYAFSASKLLPTTYPISIDLTSYSGSAGRDGIEINASGDNNEAVIKANQPNFWLWSSTANDWANLKVKDLNATNQICIQNDCKSSWPSGITGSGASNKVAFWSGTSTLSYNNNFHWDNTNQRLGIGTTAPKTPLQVQGAIMSRGGFTNPNDGVQSLTLHTGADSSYIRSAIWGSTYTELYYDARNHIFQTGGGTTSEKMRITQGGNVGIGTEIPGAKLHVAGNMKIDGSNTLEFGAGVAGKEVSAGKIGYQVWTGDALDIVGAGTTSSNRKIKFWSEGGATFNGNLNIGTNQLILSGSGLQDKGGDHLRIWSGSDRVKIQHTDGSAENLEVTGNANIDGNTNLYRIITNSNRFDVANIGSSDNYWFRVNGAVDNNVVLGLYSDSAGGNKKATVEGNLEVAGAIYDNNDGDVNIGESLTVTGGIEIQSPSFDQDISGWLDATGWIPPKGIYICMCSSSDCKLDIYAYDDLGGWGWYGNTFTAGVIISDGSNVRWSRGGGCRYVCKRLGI
jgi:hypothetical protein